MCIGYMQIVRPYLREWHIWHHGIPSIPKGDCTLYLFCSCLMCNVSFSRSRLTLELRIFSSPCGGHFPEQSEAGTLKFTDTHRQTLQPEDQFLSQTALHITCLGLGQTWKPTEQKVWKVLKPLGNRLRGIFPKNRKYAERWTQKESRLMAPEHCAQSQSESNSLGPSFEFGAVQRMNSKMLFPVLHLHICTTYQKTLFLILHLYLTRHQMSSW